MGEGKVIRVENSKDLLLMLLYAPGSTGELNEPVRGRTRLTKMVFLFFMEFYERYGFDKLIKDKPEFTPYKYGPFSKDVFEDIDFFENIGFLIVEEELRAELSGAAVGEMSKFNQDLVIEYDASTYEYEEEFFRLSEKGVSCARQLFDGLSDRQKDALGELKRKYGSIPLYTLVAYVYKTYPKYAAKSQIRDRYSF